MQPHIRPLRASELPAASELVQRVFDEFEAPDYPAEGIATFRRFTTPEAMSARLHSSQMHIWGAFCHESLTGVLASRPGNHLSLLFVDPSHHRQGIARALFDTFRSHCLSVPSPILRITVNSSPYAVAIYRHLGFTATGTELTADGIRYTPMEHIL